LSALTSPDFSVQEDDGAASAHQAGQDRRRCVAAGEVGEYADDDSASEAEQEHHTTEDRPIGFPITVARPLQLPAGFPITTTDSP
jgi:hypothetical protein